jgi:Flp pilus assembly protein TadG
MRLGHRSARRGSIVPLAALIIMGLFAFIALAIDLGALMIARNQCQNAADAAAMAGARTLTGDASTNNNYSNVQPNAQTAAADNTILGAPVTSSQLSVTIGDYYYDTPSSSFKINPNGRQEGDNWTLVQATVTYSRPTFFSAVWGNNTLNTGATATAAHRPRDTVVVVDFSGSMRFDSLLGTPYFGNRTLSMNPDTVYPTFGHYNGNASLLTFQHTVQGPGGEIQGAANDAVVTQDGNPVIPGFYGDSSPFGTGTPAFTQASNSFATTPGGDQPLTTNYGGTSNPATDVKDFLNGKTTRDWRFELDGYASYSGGSSSGNPNIINQDDYANVPWNGYVQGPGYWGKTFFTWPPDPRIPLQTPFMTTAQAQSQVKQFLSDFGWSAAAINSLPVSKVWSSWPWASAAALKTYLTTATPAGCGLSATDPRVHQLLRLANRAGGAGLPQSSSGSPVPCDWRTRFFTMPDGVTPLTDNSRLYSGGSLQAPSSSTYLINYNAILDWIKNCGPNPFPNQLRAGGCVYYTQIPTTINTGTFPPADPNQRFWKEYIDEVLGLQQTGGSGTSPNYSVITPNTGYGDDFGWGTTQTSGVPASQYMSYTDNPKRPLLHFWFGPISLVDYLGNYNMSRFWWPGTVTEAPTYQTKLGVQAAIKDIFVNHPNDNVSLVFFSSPKPDAGSTGYYNYARVPLGRDYTRMDNSLWFSPKVINSNAEINVYDANGNFTNDILDVPRANGGTCYAMPLMLAYNQFSSNSALVTYTQNATAGTAGGLGRNGAARLLVFETDGMVNTGAQAGFVTSGNGTGYYHVRVADPTNWGNGGNEFPTNVTGVSFSTGATQSQTIAQQICNPLASGGFSTTRKPVLIHCIAFGSLFDPSNTDAHKTNALQNLASLEVIGGVQQSGATTLAPNKIIVGPFQTRINNMTAAFRSIMQDGVQVTLLSSGPGLP